MKNLLLVLVFICLNNIFNAQGLPKKTLLALSKNDHVLALVDAISLKVMARIPVGEDPHEVIASTDGKLAFVTIYGGGRLHELDVIDLIQQKPLASIDTRPLFGPHGLTFADGKAWFTAEGSKSIGRYDPLSGKLDWSMGTGQDRTHMLYVSNDGKKIYTTNVSSGTVSILINNAGNWEQTIVAVEKGSEGFDVSPDGNELWTASGQGGAICIINTTEKRLLAKTSATVPGANRVKFTPDGTRVFISSLQTGELAVIDTKSRMEIKRIKTGHGAAGILMDPDGSRAFIGCSADNYVAVIDLKTLEITSHIDVGGQPDGLAWAVMP